MSRRFPWLWGSARRSPAQTLIEEREQGSPHPPGFGIDFWPLLLLRIPQYLLPTSPGLLICVPAGNYLGLRTKVWQGYQQHPWSPWEPPWTLLRQLR